MRNIFTALLLVFCIQSLEAQWLKPDTVELHKRDGLPNFFQKIKSGAPTKIGYLGGSITETDGWRVLVNEWLEEHYKNDSIISYNAGVGGTTSLYGIHRLARDLLRKDVFDLIFVEFAVNDGNVFSDDLEKSMEGIIRQIWNTNPYTDICFTYTIRNMDLPDIEQGKLFRAAAIHDSIAAYYHVPSITWAVEVAKMLATDTLIFTEPGTSFNTVQNSQGQYVFAFDNVHPTIYGHSLFKDVLARSFQRMDSHSTSFKHSLKPTLIEGNYEGYTSTKPYQHSNHGMEIYQEEGDFTGLNRFLPSLDSLLIAEDSTQFYTFEFIGERIGLSYIAGPSTGRYMIEFDGEKTEWKAFEGRTGYTQRFISYTLPSYGLHKVKVYPSPNLMTWQEKEDLMKSESRKQHVRDNIALYSRNELIISDILHDGEYIQFSPQVIQGKVFHDIEKNCSLDQEDIPLEGWKVTAQPGDWHGFTNLQGEYTIFLDTTGTFSLHVEPPYASIHATEQLFCSPAPLEFPKADNQVYNQDFALQTVNCPLLRLELIGGKQEPCQKGFSQLQIRNIGTQLAEDVEVYIEYPSLISPLSSFPTWDDQSAKNLIYRLGDLEAGSQTNILITDSVSCLADIQGLAQSIQAEAFPRYDCSNLRPMEDATEITAKGICLGDRVRFTITNISSKPMRDIEQLKVFGDLEYIARQDFVLKAGELLELEIETRGQSIRLEWDPIPSNSLDEKKSITIEGCAHDLSQASKGYAPQYPTFDAAETYDLDWQLLLSSPAEAQFQISPLGFGPERIIEVGTNLEYTLEFKLPENLNPPFSILDTLPEQLDGGTFRMMAASHPYMLTSYGTKPQVFRWTFDTLENNPDLPADMQKLLISFCVKTKPELAKGTPIDNMAYILGPDEAPILINAPSLHIGPFDFIENFRSFDLVTATEEVPVLPDLRIYPNPSQDWLYIDLPPSAIPTWEVQILNAQGQAMTSGPILPNEGRLEICLRALPRGIYYVRLKNADYSLSRKILIP